MSPYFGHRAAVAHGSFGPLASACVELVAGHWPSRYAHLPPLPYRPLTTRPLIWGLSSIRAAGPGGYGARAPAGAASGGATQ
jgi:hypothetical protein